MLSPSASPISGLTGRPPTGSETAPTGKIDQGFCDMVFEGCGTANAATDVQGEANSAGNVKPVARPAAKQPAQDQAEPGSSQTDATADVTADASVDASADAAGDGSDLIVPAPTIAPDAALPEIALGAPMTPQADAAADLTAAANSSSNGSAAPGSPAAEPVEAKSADMKSSSPPQGAAPTATSASADPVAKSQPRSHDDAATKQTPSAIGTAAGTGAEQNAPAPKPTAAPNNAILAASKPQTPDVSVTQTTPGPATASTATATAPTGAAPTAATAATAAAPQSIETGAGQDAGRRPSQSTAADVAAQTDRLVDAPDTAAPHGTPAKPAPSQSIDHAPTASAPVLVTAAAQNAAATANQSEAPHAAAPRSAPAQTATPTPTEPSDAPALTALAAAPAASTPAKAGGAPEPTSARASRTDAPAARLRPTQADMTAGAAPLAPVASQVQATGAAPQIPPMTAEALQSAASETAAPNMTVAPADADAALPEPAPTTTTSSGLEAAAAGAPEPREAPRIDPLMAAAGKRFATTMAQQSPVAQATFAIARDVAAAADLIRIQLYPRELGEVEVTLEVRDDQRAEAVVRAERPETMEMLQKDARELQRALQAAGLNVSADDLSFELGGGRGEGRDETAANGDRSRNGDAAANNDDAPKPAPAYWRTPTLGGIDLVA